MIQLKKMSPGRFIVLGFALVILIGAILLSLPISHNKGIQVSFIDSLFISTSAVCVTGLVTLDIADTFSVFGQTVVAALIQIGGLGFASIGVGFILIRRKKVSFKNRIIIKEAMNLDSMKGIVQLVRSVLAMTLFFEGIGALLSFMVFVKDFAPLKALGMSIFHAISSFNNSGFDLLGSFQSLTPYKDNILLNLTTGGLIVFGGLGFVVIQEIIHKTSFKKFSLHTKVVITMTLSLLVIGTLLFKATEEISWLGALFFSISTRTAGFATYSVGDFSNAGLFAAIVLMFIGASPGSTGGGIKTTTAFTLIKSVYSVSTNQHCVAFKRKFPREIIYKAFTVTLLAASVVCLNTFFVSILEPDYTFLQVLFEVVSAFGTVGLSTGITPELGSLSKVIIIITMFIGRLGPLTIASIWAFKQKSNVCYSEEGLTVG